MHEKTIINNIKKSYSENNISEPLTITNVVMYELSQLNNKNNLKILDSYNCIDDGFYIYFSDNKYYIRKVVNFESFMHEIDNETLIQILSLSYFVRFLSYGKNSNIKLIIDTTKKINVLCNKYFN